MSYRLLHLEGVNLGNTIDDTEDLATRRGSGLLLLEAVDAVAKRFDHWLQPISTGASVGLFELTAAAPADVADQVLKHLRTDPTYGTLTHVCAVAESSCFAQAREQALAKCRWQQMQQLTVSPVGLAPASGKTCELDRVRAAAQGSISLSVQTRRDHGQRRKQNFYQHQLADPRYQGLRYTQDFNDLACDAPHGLEPATLDGKVAVFYADGNGFGKIGRGCMSPAALREWDSYLKLQRKALLSGLVERAMREPRWQRSDGTLRFETLLWGGDELRFVVPAWCALELADLFFELTRDMQYLEPPPCQAPPPDPADRVTNRLTHACGLVMCHRQAPISSITRLSQALAEEGKRGQPGTNSLNWTVLESFDHAGDDLAGFLHRRFPKAQPALGWADLALGAEAVALLRAHLPALKTQLPRSSITRTVRMMADGQAFGSGGQPVDLVRRSYRQVQQSLGSTSDQAAFEALWLALQPTHQQRAAWDAELASPHDLPTWVKLVELWDYAPCFAAANATGASK